MNKEEIELNEQHKKEMEDKYRLERKLNRIYEKLLDIEEMFNFIQTEKVIKEFEYEIKEKQERVFDIKSSRCNSYERKQSKMDYFNEKY